MRYVILIQLYTFVSRFIAQGPKAFLQVSTGDHFDDPSQLEPLLCGNPQQIIGIGSILWHILEYNSISPMQMLQKNSTTSVRKMTNRCATCDRSYRSTFVTN